MDFNIVKVAYLKFNQYLTKYNLIETIVMLKTCCNNKNMQIGTNLIIMIMKDFQNQKLMITVEIKSSNKDLFKA